MIAITKRYLEMAKYHEKMSKKEKDVKQKKYHEKMHEFYLHLIDREGFHDKS